MTDSTLVAPACAARPVQQRRAPADSAALLAAADADADAFADRLHDGALQALVVARYAADAAVRGGDAALARDAVQEALVALRRAVWDLRPRGAGDLPAALGDLSQRRAEAGAGALRLDVDAAACAGLSAAARGAAYRFVQAAAPADVAAAVRVTQECGVVVVTTGGAPDDLLGWTARAAAVGGHLDTTGPTARLLLPLDRADDADPEDAR